MRKILIMLGMFKKESKLNFKLIALILSIVVIIGLFTSRVIWIIDLDSGSQAYHRLIFGVEVKSLSEYDYFECSGDWENPVPNLSGVHMISNCNLLSICKNALIESSVITKGCKKN